MEVNGGAVEGMAQGCIKRCREWSGGVERCHWEAWSQGEKKVTPSLEEQEENNSPEEENKENQADLWDRVVLIINMGALRSAGLTSSDLTGPGWARAPGKVSDTGGGRSGHVFILFYCCLDSVINFSEKYDFFLRIFNKYVWNIYENNDDAADVGNHYAESVKMNGLQ